MSSCADHTVQQCLDEFKLYRLLRRLLHGRYYINHQLSFRIIYLMLRHKMVCLSARSFTKCRAYHDAARQTLLLFFSRQSVSICAMYQEFHFTVNVAVYSDVDTRQIVELFWRPKVSPRLAPASRFLIRVIPKAKTL